MRRPSGVRTPFGRPMACVASNRMRSPAPVRTGASGIMAGRILNLTTTVGDRDGRGHHDARSPASELARPGGGIRSGAKEADADQPSQPAAHLALERPFGPRPCRLGRLRLGRPRPGGGSRGHDPGAVAGAQPGAGECRFVEPILAIGHPGHHTFLATPERFRR